MPGSYMESAINLTQAILSGEFVEFYPNDYPYPSCLILGTNDIGKNLHIVCGIGNGELWLITAYVPSAQKWETDLRTRKDSKA